MKNKFKIGDKVKVVKCTHDVGEVGLVEMIRENFYRADEWVYGVKLERGEIAFDEDSIELVDEKQFKVGDAVKIVLIDPRSCISEMYYTLNKTGVVVDLCGKNIDVKIDNDEKNCSWIYTENCLELVTTSVDESVKPDVSFEESYGFKKGDRVKVVKKILIYGSSTAEGWSTWVGSMDKTLNKKGVVVRVDKAGVCVKVDKESNNWYYSPKSLELVIPKEKKDCNRNGIKFPDVDAIVLYGLKDAYAVLQWNLKKHGEDELILEDMKALEHVINYFGGEVK